MVDTHNFVFAFVEMPERGIMKEDIILGRTPAAGIL